MAFDKNAYNRMYYQRNKELWEKYRQSRKGYLDGPETRYGAYGREKAREQISKNALGQFRYHQNGSRFIDPDARRVGLPQAGRDALHAQLAPRPKRYGHQMKDRMWVTAPQQPQRIKKTKFSAKDFARNLPSNWKAGASDIRDAVKRSTSSVGRKAKKLVSGMSSYGTVKKSMGNAAKNAVNSYKSAWKSGANDIKTAAKKTKKKVTKFLSKLGW